MNQAPGTNWVEQDDGSSMQRRAPPGITLLALGFASGIVLSRFVPPTLLWGWTVSAMLALIASMVVRRRRSYMLTCLVLAMMFVGASWRLLHEHFRPIDDLASMIDDSPSLIRLRGVADGLPALRSRTAGPMARFDYRPPATYFPLRVDTYIDEAHHEHDIRGKVLVRIDGVLPPFEPGDQIEVTGFLRPFPGPHNPGEFDYRAFARTLGQAGVLSVSNRDLVTIQPQAERRTWRRFLHWRNRIKQRASAWLLADLPHTDRSERNALLSALLLGQRDRQLGEIDDSFRRVGLAHMLAISGLHLGVLIGFVLVLARWRGSEHRLHGLIVIAAVLIYLFLVEIRLPVLRASVMIIAAGIAMLAGRRWRISNLIALSAIAILLWRPSDLFTPGFQLSFGVVLALVHFAPTVRVRWLGEPNLDAATTGEMIKHWALTTLIVATVAWLIATPVTMHHFGMVSPLGIVMSVVALPIVALLLAVGFSKMLLSIVLPSAGLLIGAVLAFAAEVLVILVATIDALPGTVLHVPPPSALWTICMITCIAFWLAGGVRRLQHRRLLHRGVIALIILLALWPLRWLLPIHGSDALRIDMLSVGDGSCYVLRSGGDTMIFDAGSSTDLAAGERSIVPALRRLGVRDIDAIIISHANLDHYAAVLDLADAFDTPRVLVTPHFMRSAETDPHGPVAFLLDELTLLRTSVIAVETGHVETLGHATITWLHPHDEDRFRIVNDSSMVMRVEAAGVRALLTGDIQHDAIDRLLKSHPNLHPDIVELPHHGSFTPAAVEFVRAMKPKFVMQSTGYRRWLNDRWAVGLDSTTRLITARDGACSIVVHDDGNITFNRFLRAD